MTEEDHAVAGATSGCVSEWASVWMCPDLGEETIDGRRAGEPTVADVMVWPPFWPSGLRVAGAVQV